MSQVFSHPGVPLWAQYLDFFSPVFTIYSLRPSSSILNICLKSSYFSPHLLLLSCPSHCYLLPRLWLEHLHWSPFVLSHSPEIHSLHGSESELLKTQTANFLIKALQCLPVALRIQFKLFHSEQGCCRFALPDSPLSMFVAFCFAFSVSATLALFFCLQYCQVYFQNIIFAQ